MNGSTETTRPANSSHAHDWQPRPELLQAIQEIAAIVEGDDTALVTDREIRFQNGAEHTTIKASNVDLVTVDGHRISERIDIRTSLPPVFTKMTLEQLALANTMTTTGAIVVDPDTGCAEVASSITVFEVDTQALAQLYTPVVAIGALLHSYGPMAAASRLTGTVPTPPDEQVIPTCNEPGFWAGAEFAYAAEWMRSGGIYCNADETGLTAEFPWEEGASSAMLGDCTSLFQLQSDTRHPTAGNGLFFTLKLPVNVEVEQLAECANYLNNFELNGVDTPPFFGAWCSRLDDGTLTFAGFWPNCMYRGGTAANIASWCCLRSRIARQAIGNM